MQTLVVSKRMRCMRTSVNYAICVLQTACYWIVVVSSCYLFIISCLFKFISFQFLRTIHFFPASTFNFSNSSCLFQIISVAYSKLYAGLIFFGFFNLSFYTIFFVFFFLLISNFILSFLRKFFQFIVFYFLSSIYLFFSLKITLIDFQLVISLYQLNLYLNLSFFDFFNFSFLKLIATLFKLRVQIDLFWGSIFNLSSSNFLLQFIFFQLTDSI